MPSFLSAAEPNRPYSLNRFLGYVDHVDKWKLMHRMSLYRFDSVYTDNAQIPNWKPGLTMLLIWCSCKTNRFYLKSTDQAAETPVIQCCRIWRKEQTRL